MESVRQIEEYARIFWGEFLSASNIKGLRRRLSVDIPKNLLGQFGAKDLPFPPDLVEKITEKEVKFLQQTFRRKNEYRYFDWASHYYDLNSLALLETGPEVSFSRCQKRSEATRRVSENLNVPLAALFFLVSKSFYIEQRRRSWQRDRKRKTKALRSVERQITILRNSVNSLVTANEIHHKGIIRSVEQNIQATVGRWIETFQLEEGLVRLQHGISLIKSEIDDDLDDAHIRMIAGGDPYRGETTSNTFRAFEGTVELIKKFWRVYGAKQEARNLFSE